jgi:hypothetical protein
LAKDNVLLAASTTMELASSLVLGNVSAMMTVDVIDASTMVNLGVPAMARKVADYLKE